jgi:hypothetical protein
VVPLTATRGGIRIDADDAQLDALHDEFARAHVVRLPRFLDDGLLARVRAEIDRGEFVPREDKDIAVELSLQPCRAHDVLSFVMNAPQLFAFIRRMTDCASIGSFTGRIYRFDPRVAHHDSWHDDTAAGGRLIGFSLNLGDSYRGGVFQLREKAQPESIVEIANIGAADAFIFRIDNALQHRVTPVEGEQSKTAFAGWFIEGEFDAGRLFAEPRS